MLQQLIDSLLRLYDTIGIAGVLIGLVIGFIIIFLYIFINNKFNMYKRAQKYYSFIVLDPPIASDIDKKVKPKRSLICILSLIVAGFFAMFIAFFLEFIHNVKHNEDEERLSNLRKHLKVHTQKGS